MKTVKNIFVLTSTVAALLASGTASAAEKTADFYVTIRIKPVCEVVTLTGGMPSQEETAPSAGADINFGEYESNHKAIVDGLSAAGASDGIQVKCTKGTPYQIALTPDSTSSTTGTGNMKGLSGTAAETSGDVVAYSLYRDSARSNAWGNQDNVNTLSATGAGIATTQKYPVYGRVAADQFDKTAGRYSDRVAVAVKY